MTVSAAGLRFLSLLTLATVAALPVNALADNDFSIGGEGFEDIYKEPSATVDTHTTYGSATASYTHIGNDFFTGIDGRYSHGRADYKSDSGTLNGIPDTETDTRIRTGAVIQLWHGLVMPYIGVGWRWYYDNGKGLYTNLGDYAYDRHINQLYLPIGATYKFTSADGWTIAPTLEMGPLLRGWVDSHLDPTVQNIQKKGFEFRSELMFGQEYSGIGGWEIGPFIRYWHMQDSNCIVPAGIAIPAGECLEEPKNNRVQAGGALRINF